MRLGSAIAGLFVAFGLIYLPDIGHGFIKDDFAWIRGSQWVDATRLLGLFGANVGFYRPIVSVSFTADHALWGVNPLGYSVTNLALLFMCALLLVTMARRLGLPTGAAVLSGAVWVFNFHGVNMALLWLSGRTALLVTLFSLATALALLGGRRLYAGLFCLGAMLSKEEAVFLPALFTTFFFLDPVPTPRTSRWREVLSGCWPLWLSLVVYAGLRLQSGAFGPFDAPSYYQFSLSPTLIVRNVGEYTDRAATVALAVSIILFLAAGARRPSFLEHERRVLILAALWTAATYALTVPLPIRSSLYALLPSIGPALGAGVIASWNARQSHVRFVRTAAALVILVLLLVPVYRSRNLRWVAPADLSTRVMQTVESATIRRPDGGRIVLFDAPEERWNLDSAFGTLFPDAVALLVGPRWTGEIFPRGQPLPFDNAVSFKLSEGRLVPLY